MSQLFKNEIAIDLGTANTLLWTEDEGVVINEPSIVAVNTRLNTIEAIGSRAKAMVGRTPGDIVAIRPLRDGVIADFEVTEKMLEYFISKAVKKKVLVRPKVVISVPSEITPVEMRAVQDSAYRAKASEVYLILESMAAAIGAGLPINEPTGNMIVDIGGGTTDIAVISLSGLVYSRTIKTAGDSMDDAIIQYIKKKYNLLTGEAMAEKIKVNLGSAYPLDEELTMEIKGRDLVAGVPTTLRINDSEIREALSEVVNTIVETIKIALERTPPELAADFVDKGVMLTGGGSQLKNLDKRLREETGLPVTIAEHPLTTVVEGTGYLLKHPELLKKIALTK
ncbi:MAG: rod shape-determining protein [Acidobacteria bacterium]|nr:rod shape-determining protein [Acidobacteriota bacterium]